MRPTQQSRVAPLSPRAIHARHIFVGADPERFRKVFLRPFLDRHARVRAQALILDVSEGALLCREVAAARLDDEVRADITAAPAPRGDAGATEHLMRLVARCDPGARPNEVVFDLRPDDFPQLAVACEQVASKWFRGLGPRQPAPSDALESFPPQVNLEELRRHIKRRRFPRRPSALLMGAGDILRPFADKLFNLSRPWLSFTQLSEDAPPRAELWPWRENPALVFCDADTFEHMSEWSWLGTTCVLGAEERGAAAATVERLASDAAQRARFPEAIVTWSPREPETAAAAWVTRPLARGGHTLPDAEEYQPRPDLEPLLTGMIHDWRPGGAVIAGLGGAGKSTLMHTILKRCRLTAAAEAPAADADELPPADALFVWDFDARPFPHLFMRSLAEYLNPGREVAPAADPDECLRLIREGLRARDLRRFLLALDGLEVLQRARRGSLYEGELLFKPLAQLLEEIDAELLPIFAIITSRLAPTELFAEGEPRRGRNFVKVEVGALGRAEARALLRACGVGGDDARLDALTEDYGRNALNVHYLGRLLADFHGGDPEAVRRLPELFEESGETGVPEIDNSNQLFARIAAGYEERLDYMEAAVLGRVATFETPLSVELFADIYLATGDEYLAGPLAGMTADELQPLFERLLSLRLLTARASDGGPTRYAMHSTFAEYFAAALTLDLEAISPEGAEPPQQGRPQAQPRAAAHAAAARRGKVGPAEQRVYPRTPVTLALYERLIEQTVRTGRTEEARLLYQRRMGGEAHLLGINEDARAERIRGWLGGQSAS